MKRNGDYVDYADYGARIEQYQPNLPVLEYDGVSVTDGYRETAPSAYDNVLSKLNTVLNSAALADFRTGIRTGDWIDRNTNDPEKEEAEKEEEEEQKEEEEEEGYREDIDSQKVAGDTGEGDDTAIPSTEVVQRDFVK